MVLMRLGTRRGWLLAEIDTLVRAAGVGQHRQLCGDECAADEDGQAS